MKKSFLFVGLSVLALSLTAPAVAKSCKDFPTQAAAQEFYEARKASGQTGWKNLDRDGDGKACDCNAGGTGKNCPKKKK
nr:MAG TPA: Excalibur calcium-binding domain protein [Caudoviricetes sp.]